MNKKKKFYLLLRKNLDWCKLIYIINRVQLIANSLPCYIPNVLIFIFFYLYCIHHTKPDLLFSNRFYRGIDTEELLPIFLILPWAWQPINQCIRDLLRLSSWCVDLLSVPFVFLTNPAYVRECTEKRREGLGLRRNENSFL